MAVTADDVWVATNTGLVQLDPTTLKVRNVDEVGRFGLAASADAVWVSDFGGGTVARLDPATSKQTTSVELPDNPNAIAITMAQRGSPNTAMERSPDPGTSGEAPRRDRGRAGGVKRAAGRRRRRQSRVGRRPEYRVGRPDRSLHEQGRGDGHDERVAMRRHRAASRTVWVSSCFDDHAIRIDPRTNTLVAEIDIGGYNGGPIIVDGYPWFPVYNQLVRIDPRPTASTGSSSSRGQQSSKHSERPWASIPSGSAAMESSRESRSMRCTMPG